MVILVLCDPHYYNSPWCDNKLRGIQDEIVRRRDKKAKVYTDPVAFEAAAARLGRDSTVIILFDAISYIQTVAPIFSRLSVHPMITYTASEIRLPFYHSVVSSDVDASIRRMVDYLQGCGKKRIAKVGVNPDSWSDATRAELFMRYVPDVNRRVFYATGDMRDCFSEFLSVREEFDAVVCPNDHLAISLIEFLKEQGAYDPSLFVISHGDTAMARLYGNGITSITVDHYRVGRAAAETHYNRLKYGWSFATLFLENEMKIRGSTENIPYRPSLSPPKASNILPPSEPLLFRIPTNALGSIERLLATSDISELKLLYCLLSDYTNEKTGEFCFLSIEAVKYRVRKICRMLQALSKTEATAILRRYIRKERLLYVIEEFEGAGARLFE